MLNLKKFLKNKIKFKKALEKKHLFHEITSHKNFKVIYMYFLKYQSSI